MYQYYTQTPVRWCSRSPFRTISNSIPNPLRSTDGISFNHPSLPMTFRLTPNFLLPLISCWHPSYCHLFPVVCPRACELILVPSFPDSHVSFPDLHVFTHLPQVFILSLFLMEGRSDITIA